MIRALWARCPYCGARSGTPCFAPTGRVCPAHRLRMIAAKAENPDAYDVECDVA